ncbi:MAG TPA: PAS domain S-box protein [Acidimicrobiales bacterium]|nr:PAS domain S-box protein [Acidimicrobiales bacterium]
MTEARYDVVVVDDAPEVRRVVAHALRLSGRFVVTGEGESGTDAIELVGRHRPAVLLLDASMPGLDGFDAIPAVKRASPETRVVMLSGFDAPGLAAKAMDLGADAYIEKARPVPEIPCALLAILGAEGDDNAGPPPAEAASEVMAEHLERFRTVFDQAAIGMATLTLTGRIVRANRALAAFTGREEQDLVGLPYAELAPPPGRGEVASALERVGGGAAPSRHVEHEVADGRWAHSTIAAVTDSEGRPLYLFAQAEDVTGRRAMIEQLLASEERFRLMVESVQDYAIFMLDADGRVATWNLGAGRMKGYRADEIIGRHFRTFYPEEEQLSRHPEHNLEVATREGRYEEEGWRVRKDGSMFWANVVITALFDHDRKLVGFAKVTRDMSERRRAQEEREVVARELEAANVALRSAAERIEEFLAVTAHELQSPISAITGAADILLEYWDRLDADERRETLGHITRGGARIRRLLSDLLTASRLEAGAFELQLERVDVGSALKEAVAEAGAGDEDIAVVGDPHLAVRADRTRLVQILTNLLTNAAKYGKRPIVIEVASAAGDVEVRVRDHGPGVPDDLGPRLFEKFARGGGGRARGTGLGLFIVRELARLQGGDAWYEAAEGGGACFVVRLPSAS